MRRQIIELVAAVGSGAAAVWCWFGAQTTVMVVAAPGEPQTTSIAYSAPMLVLMLLLGTVAGVLAVVGLTDLIRRRSSR
jgi:hypothetical protein